MLVWAHLVDRICFINYFLFFQFNSKQIKFMIYVPIPIVIIIKIESQ
jgi:hypothetical protein